jgi:hypothetical protein
MSMIRVTVNSTSAKVSRVASPKASLASRQAGTAKPASNRDTVRANGKVARTASFGKAESGVEPPALDRRSSVSPSRSRRIMVPIVDKTGKPLGEIPQSASSIRAGKIAHGEVVFSRRFGYYAWVKE